MVNLFSPHLHLFLLVMCWFCGAVVRVSVFFFDPSQSDGSVRVICLLFRLIRPFRQWGSRVAKNQMRVVLVRKSGGLWSICLIPRFICFCWRCGGFFLTRRNPMDQEK